MDKCTQLPNSWARYPKENIFSFLIFKFFRCLVGPQRFALGPSVPTQLNFLFCFSVQTGCSNWPITAQDVCLEFELYWIWQTIFFGTTACLFETFFLLYTFSIFFLCPANQKKKTIFFTHCTKLEPNLLFLFWIMHQTNKLGALSKRDTLYFRCGGWWHIHPGQILASPFQNGPQFQLIGRSLGIYGWFCFKSLNTYHVCHIFDNSCCLLCFFHLYHYCH